MEEKGLVFNIQKFSLHDGHGIRTIVFFKGCPLKCQWCSNPESQNLKAEIYFAPQKCIGCRQCELVCRSGARKDGIWNREICSGCLSCTEVCASGALELIGNWMSIEDIVRDVEKDCIFYETSGGGVTLSGGEPLMQYKFAAKLAAALKFRYLDVAMETTGYAKYEHLHEVAQYCDTVLFDIKHMDSKVHKTYTGIGNELILENAKKIASEGKKICIRIPILGGINNSEKNIKETAEFVRSIGVDRIDLLPYHKYGLAKYEKLGKEYICDAYVPSDDDMLKLKQIIESFGLSVEIGG